MEDFVRIFKSSEGDVYHITLSEDSRVLSENVRKALGGVHVAGIDLRRLEGTHVTGQDVLRALANAIAEFISRIRMLSFAIIATSLILFPTPIKIPCLHKNIGADYLKGCSNDM